MLKKIFLLTFLCLICATQIPAAGRAGEWKHYTTFDQYVKQVIDTRDKTYALVLGQYYNKNEKDQYNKPFPMMLVYDKASDELKSLNRANLLSENIVYGIYYNREKGYLFIVYDNGNIDLLYDDGTIRNIPGLKTFATNSPKNVNNVTFDPEEDKIYIAAEFGFFVINDKKYEISESKFTESPVKVVGRIGDRIIVSTQNGVYSYPKNKLIQGISDMTPMQGMDGLSKLMPLSNGRFGFIATYITDKGTNEGDYLFTAAMNPDGTIEDRHVLHHATLLDSSEVQDGYYLCIPSAYVLLKMDGTIKTVPLPLENGLLTSSWDFREFWFLKGREGLQSMRYNAQDNVWNITRQFMKPDAPNVFRSQFMQYTDKYGFLIVNHGTNRVFIDHVRRIPNLLSGYKDGHWTSYGLPYVNPAYSDAHTYPRGMAIDPENQAMIYFASLQDGLMRMNLDDPNDIIRIANKDCAHQDLPKFYPLIPGSGYSFTMAPKFDSQGNLWTFNYDSGSETNNYAWIWPSAAKKASDPNGLVKIKVNGLRFTDAHGDIFPCKSPVNKNLVIFWPGEVKGDIYVLNHNGTLSDTSDDKVARMTSLVDQDGGVVSKRIIYDMWEDMQTGTIWVANIDGLFTFNPRETFSNPNAVRKIKISRNDGTSLADYLLSGLVVYSITTDNAGDKWFGTGGGGIIHTSSDGTRVIEQFTTENSMIPDDAVYCVRYNPQNHSIFASTEKGLAEYYLPGGGSGGNSDKDNVKIYPNPVRPDYYGWINIEGLSDNSLVKIVDSAGNIVRELGRAEGGSIQWDATNHARKKVRSGVYYVLASSTGEGGESNVGKIVIIN